MAEATCPASCGELIQGWISGSEKLVSCPINWFSTVSVTTGNALPYRERPLMRKALKLALKTLEIPVAESARLKIDYASDIPVAKGMASSTADIAATIAATYRHFRANITEQDIAALCAHLEPTDSTMFSVLTLFDHHKGTISKQLGTPANLDILVLENHTQISTAAYHTLPRRPSLIRSADRLSKAAYLLAQAIQKQENSLLGAAATTSAIESQAILPKPFFTELLDLVEKYSLYGLNVAHSGSVVGLLYNATKHDIEQIIREISGSPAGHVYFRCHQQQLISGGIR